MNTLQKLIAEMSLSQTDIAKKTGFTSGAVSKQLRKGKLSAEAAVKYEAVGIPRWRSRPDLFPIPAPTTTHEASNHGTP